MVEFRLPDNDFRPIEVCLEDSPIQRPLPHERADENLNKRQLTEEKERA